MAADGDFGDASDSGCGERVTINIRCANSSTKFAVQANLGVTVAVFKMFLAESCGCEIPAGQQRLIYKGRILNDDQTLESYGLQADHTVHMVRGLPSASTQTRDATNLGGQNTSPGVARGVNSDEGGGLGPTSLGASLFSRPGGLVGNGVSGGLFGSRFLEFEHVQQQLTQNPNIAREIMDIPAIQSLVNNPDIMRNMIMSNPQMHEIIDRNPELAHILNDPNTLRQTLEAARNPEIMREMMRNTDRAMSNLESSPEGFNMLRRMYETVQEPFLNATIMSGETGNDMGTSPLSVLLGRDGEHLFSSHPLITGSETSTGSPMPNTTPLPNPWSGGGGGVVNNATRSSPAADARAGGIGGLGGLGLPEMERVLDDMGMQEWELDDMSMQYPSQLNQTTGLPAWLPMMQSLLSNSQAINQITRLNPQLVLDYNSQLREMFQNPRQLASSEALQQILTLQQEILTTPGRDQSTPEAGQTISGTGTGIPNNMGLDPLMSRFSGLGVGAGGMTVPNISNVPPEELYATELIQLHEMGFFDTQENIRALSATGGNIHAALERLFGNLGQ